MTRDEGRSVLSRTLKVGELADDVSGQIDVTEAERGEIAGLLDLEALDPLIFRYRVRRGAGGRLSVTGTLEAGVTQTCVVSLDPLKKRLELPVEMEFWPATLPGDLEKAEDSGSSDFFEWPEPIIDGTVDLGPIIYESLATALDPYPKREGASFEWSQVAEGTETGDDGPFAALKQLKRS